MGEPEGEEGLTLNSLAPQNWGGGASCLVAVIRDNHRKNKSHRRLGASGGAFAVAADA